MKNPKILYIAPLLDFSGYANAARNYVRALDSVGCNLVTRPLRYDGGSAEMSDREKLLANKDLFDVDIVLAHTTPNEMGRKDGCFNVCYFAWETDRVPAEWVQQLNKMDLIMVPCEDNVVACTIGGVKVPVVKIPHTFDSSIYNRRIQPYDMPGFEDYFKILTICQLSKKKGIDSLLFSYLNEFTTTDKVVLVLKVYFGPNDGESEKNILIDQINAVKNALRLKTDLYPKIKLIHGVTGDDSVAKLYKTCDLYALPSRGEGFSITHFDALGYGLPAIGLNCGGVKEFLTNDTGWLVDYNMTPCHSMPHPHPFMYTAADNWAEPNILSLRSALRSAYNEWLIHKTTRREDSPWQRKINMAREVSSKYTYDCIGNLMKETIMSHYLAWKDKNGY